MSTIDRLGRAAGRFLNALRSGDTVTPARGITGGPSKESYGVRTVAPDLSLGEISPSTIKAKLMAAEDGDLAAQAELFERMEEKDGELDAHFRTRKNGVLSHPWEIQPADESDAAGEVAVFVQDTLNAIEGFTTALDDLLDAIPKGYSVLEIDWGTTPDEWLPRRLLFRPQRWFEAGADGEVLLLKTGWNETAPLDPYKWVVHRAKARSGTLYRSSLMRACVRAYIVRHYAWKDWVRFAEIYGVPPRVGKLRAEADWDSDEASGLWAALKALGMNAAIMVRDGNEIEALANAATGSGEVFDRLLSAASRELTLAILGQVLTSGGEGGGSYALGQVHNEVRLDLVKADAVALEETINRQLIEPVVLLNFGPGAPMPRLNFVIDEPFDTEALARTVQTLVDAGLEVPAGWAHEKFGIPVPEEGEQILERSRRGGPALPVGGEGPERVAAHNHPPRPFG